MRIIDLSYDLSKDTVMYPGLFKPAVEEEATIAKNGVNIKRMTLITHTGTHVDAPRHFYDTGVTVDEIQLSKVMGEAVVVELAKDRKAGLIDPEELVPYDKTIRRGDILILNTGIYKRYGTREYTHNYPAISREAAQWIISKGVATLATDATSVDPYQDSAADAHYTILGAGIPIIENLANLGRITQGRFFFICLPLKIKGGDGAPCRAVAIEGML
ncbi:MAG: cyclase family protein [Spirochaetes bacterium]|nr:cyclase family protein [Spirochaetota bacterium]